MEFPKKMLLIACSEKAWLLQRRLCECIKEKHPETETVCKVKCRGLELLSEKNAAGRLCG